MSSTISPGMHPVISALRVIGTGLDELAEGNLWSLLDSEALEVRVELERLAARLYGAKLASTRDVDSRGAAVKAGASSLRAWLINKVRLHPGEASREVLLATQLDTDLPATAAALAAGAITPAAAAVIAVPTRSCARSPPPGNAPMRRRCWWSSPRPSRWAGCSTRRSTWATG
jgi:hypothetical protein